MKKVILDTNFVIDLIRFKIGLGEIEKLVDGKCRLIVPMTVFEELEKISGQKTMDGVFARIGLMLIKEKDIDIVGVKGKMTDKVIAEMASEENAIVATNDVELRKSLRTSGVQTIYLRAKKHLAMD